MESHSIVFDHKVERAPEVYSFRFKADSSFTYIAGQYGVFSLNKEDKKLSKPFTFSSAPGEKCLELTTILSGSEYKNALNSLRRGDAVELKGPMGALTIEAAAGRAPVFLAGGIGITPFMSIIAHSFRKNSLPETLLFYANKNVDRIVFRKELEEIESLSGNLRVINVISDEEIKEERGVFESGRINPSIIKKYLKERVTEVHYFIVGPPPFNIAMEEALAEVEVKKSRISLENFAGY